MEDFNRIKNIFELQQKHKVVINNSSAYQRKLKLKKLLDGVLKNVDELSNAIYKDFQKNKTETKLSEVFPITSELRHTIRHIKRWQKPHKINPPLAFFNSHNKILYEPKGQVLIISPWNYPFLLSIGPLISAIAAGNCVILKPSEHTPHTSLFLKNFISQIFNENEVAVIEGNYKEAQTLLSYHFDHIFFTGSTKVGKIVMTAAAQNLTSITLELGGKSPVIIDESANLQLAAQKIVWGKYLNCGQTCIAPDYILLPEHLLNEFVSLFKQTLGKIYGNIDSLDSNSDYCRIVNENQYERILSLIEDAVDCGAKIIGNFKADAKQRFLSPVLLLDVSLDSKIMSEEIFGPVLPVITYKNEHEIFDIVNRNSQPLALYVFSERKLFIKKMIDKIQAGGSVINDVVIHFSNFQLPFGGVGSSGMGKAHGFSGFKAFSNEKGIMEQPKLAPSRLLYPPYTGTVKKIINSLIKYF